MKSSSRGAAEQPELPAAALKLNSLVQRCPACHKPWSKHRVVLIASLSLGVHQLRRTEEFFCAVKAHAWDFLSQLKGRAGVGNSLEAYAVECPNHRLHILVVRSPFELHVGNEMLVCEPVSNGEREQIEEMIAKDVRPIS